MEKMKYVVQCMVGTGIMLVLNILVVTPLTKGVVRFVTRRPRYRHFISDPLVASNPDFKSLVLRCYFVIGILILGAAGFLLGLFGDRFLIAIPFETSDLPGWAAFIGMSVLGCCLHP